MCIRGGKKESFPKFKRILTAHFIHHTQKTWPIILKEPTFWQKCGKMQIERIQLAEKMLKSTDGKSLATMDTTLPHGHRQRGAGGRDHPRIFIHGADIADRG